jgi:hypothetical protein
MRWYDITKKKPPIYEKVWVAIANGRVELDERDIDNYFGCERLHFKNNGFPDLHQSDGCAVTHWGKYTPPKPPKHPLK